MIVGAVDGELKHLRGRLQRVVARKTPRGRVWQGEWKGHPVTLVRTGVGPRKARAAVKHLLANGRFRGILSIGYAGGLQPGWKVGDILIPDEILTLPPIPEATHLPDSRLVERACTRARNHRWAYHSGRMLTSQRVICSAGEKGRLGATYRAGSVEMESAVLAELARQASLPILVIRVVSDEAEDSLPESLAIMEYIRKKQVRRVLRCVITQPVQTARLFRLMRTLRRASRSLTGFITEEILDELIQEPVAGGTPTGQEEGGGTDW
jgi:adenosylhomocysteine nucleosidase